MATHRFYHALVNHCGGFIAAQRRRGGSESAWFDARAAQLTAVQKAAVGRALQALESTTEVKHNKKDLDEALNSYWLNYIVRE